MHDEDWIKRVFSVAEAHSAPPSAMDPRRAILDGKRRRRNLRIATTVAVAGITAVAAVAVPAVMGNANRGAPVTGASVSASPTPSPSLPAPPAPRTCQAQQLALPAGVKDGQVTSGDPTGRYLVGSAGNATRVMLWDNGRLRELRPPANGELVGLWVNSSGMVAGTTVESKNKNTYWLYRDGSFTVLNGATSIYHTAGMNARGDVVASWVQRDSSGQQDVRPPLVWRAGSPDQPRELLGGNGITTATGIADDGTVVGISSDFQQVPMTDEQRSQALNGVPTRRIEPVYWSPDGAPHRLSIPAGMGPQGRAFEVNGALVAGTVQSPGRPGEKVIVWHLPEGGTTVVDELWAVYAINRYGWMTGHAGSFGGNVIYSGGTLRQLPLPAWADNDGSVFSSISDDGKVVGGMAGNSSASDSHPNVPFRWLCS